jgi:hypothetical protein
MTVAVYPSGGLDTTTTNSHGNNDDNLGGSDSESGGMMISSSSSGNVVCGKSSSSSSLKSSLTGTIKATKLSFWLFLLWSANHFTLVHAKYHPVRCVVVLNICSIRSMLL